ncbi:phage tail protein [Hymenobacter negativus]|uniref:Phage tail protein n=1 Tax=Hymenobacter negativus TaxID=2795026 RepID=A0ABS0Q8P5_9BACT|nr:tail fiber protein [Hymenobacter negativus]MBH8559026.1 phage tail protein [Hymenobacter negativus]
MDPFVGEIRLLPYSYPPYGWALCNGAILPISQNTALFSLLGTRYGGNGTTTFALPDLRGRAMMGMSSNYPQGTVTGTESVTLNNTQLAAHNHTLAATVAVSTDAGTSTTPAGGYFASLGSQYGDSGGGGNMAAGLLNGTSSSVGGNQPHENRMPFLTLNYCIALQGVFPQRQ